MLVRPKKSCLIYNLKIVFTTKNLIKSNIKKAFRYNEFVKDKYKRIEKSKKYDTSCILKFEKEDERCKMHEIQKIIFVKRKGVYVNDCGNKKM